jgi:uncharacterized repeat protein (TIGR01451 family)
LDLAINGENPVTSKFTLSNIKPGDTGSYDVTFKNVGTIDASTLTLSVINLIDDEGTNPEPETNTGTPGDLSGVVDIAIKDGSTTLWTGTLSALAASSGVNLGSLAGEASKVITLEASVASTVGNDIMGDISTFDIVGQLNQ